MKAKEIRSIMEKARCRFYAPLGAAVYGDNRFIGVFPCEDIKGSLVFNENVSVKEIISGKTYNCNEIPLDMKKGDTAIFLF